ncbi:hypothetical protein, partial [Rhizobium johnstonii]|uniref:hypothetical protein n=1 Tax=Rhizobium johnstonii TaxID=3019933 RepID=UPI003F9DD051
DDPKPPVADPSDADQRVHDEHMVEVVVGYISKYIVSNLADLTFCCDKPVSYGIYYFIFIYISHFMSLAAA